MKVCEIWFHYFPFVCVNVFMVLTSKRHTIFRSLRQPLWFTLSNKCDVRTCDARDLNRNSDSRTECVNNTGCRQVKYWQDNTTYASLLPFTQLYFALLIFVSTYLQGGYIFRIYFKKQNIIYLISINKLTNYSKFSVIRTT